MEITTKEGKYLYCIIKHAQPKTFGQFGIGEEDRSVYAICFDQIAAVVSDSPIKKYTICRENLTAHERAIEEVMKTYTVLPVRFGTISENEEEVKAILQGEYHKFTELLKNMEGKKELGLKATFKECIYSRITEKYEQIRTLKEKIANSPPEKTTYQRIEIGRMVEEALKKECESSKAAILTRLLPLAAEYKINPTYGERMLLNAAFLVNKQNETKFDRKVNEIAEEFNNEINFKYVGTVPPFNFVHLVIRGCHEITCS